MPHRLSPPFFCPTPAVTVTVTVAIVTLILTLAPQLNTVADIAPVRLCVNHRDSVRQFCMPDELLLHTKRAPLPSSWGFVLTDAQHERLFGVCVSFYEPVDDEVRRDARAACCRSSWVLSPLPLPLAHSLPFHTLPNPLSSLPAQQQADGLQEQQQQQGDGQQSSIASPMFKAKSLCLLSRWYDAARTTSRDGRSNVSLTARRRTLMSHAGRSSRPSVAGSASCTDTPAQAAG